MVSKRTLMEAIWPDSYVEESNLTQTIFLLRKALGRTETGGEFVETLSKRGTVWPFLWKCFQLPLQPVRKLVRRIPPAARNMT